MRVWRLKAVAAGRRRSWALPKPARGGVDGGEMLPAVSKVVYRISGKRLRNASGTNTLADTLLAFANPACIILLTDAAFKRMQPDFQRVKLSLRVGQASIA